MLKKVFHILFIILIFCSASIAQSTFKFSGYLKYENGIPAKNIHVKLNPLNQNTTTNDVGFFQFVFTGAFDVTLHFKNESGSEFSYSTKPSEINASSPINISLPNTFINTDQVNISDDIPIINLSDDNDASLQSQEISSLLASSKDIFLANANYNLNTFRFRVRGYDNEYNSLYLNGVSMSDAESGNLVFGEWGGLNDVLRSVTTNYGVSANSFAFGKVGSNILVDTRASRMRKTNNINYASSNRTYRNRLMGTYATGKMQNGWAFTLSSSYRWAQEGYVEGSFYKGFSYFGGVEKQINKKHSLGLTLVGSKLERGKSTANTLEAYNLAGSNYYNSFWGYQNGEKRNSRTSDIHKPIGILRHDWEISKKAKLTTSISYQGGYESNKRLDWFDTRDPRPDYYKNFPSGAIDSSTAALYADLFKNVESYRQINWDYFYQINRENFETISNANGVEGNIVSGKRSQYYITDQKQNLSIINFNSVFESYFTERIIFTGGVNFQKYKSQNYQILDDLLGGDFIIDQDKFTLRDFPNLSPDNDLNSVNRIIKEGDRNGYDFDMNVVKSGAWAQIGHNLRKFDWFLAGNIGRTAIFREGNFINGRFPDSSLGKSATHNFSEYGVKAGITYKLNGRNYVYANGGHLSVAPLSENIFISPRSRNEVAPILQNETNNSIEGGYVFKAPRTNFKIVAYLSDFKNGSTINRFYNDEDLSGDPSSFVNNFITNIDRRHTGIEVAGEFKITSSLTFSAMASIGKYYYTSRFNSYYYQDFEPTLVIDNRTIYSKNYYLNGTPQEAGSLGLSYRSPKYWFLNVNANYARKAFISPFWDRRTSSSVTNLTEDDPQRKGILFQEEFADAFTLDLFGGYSYRFKDASMLLLNLGVSNLLNNQGIITSGFEQSRLGLVDDKVAVEKFPNKYYFAYGINYFASIGYRF